MVLRKKMKPKYYLKDFLRKIDDSDWDDISDDENFDENKDFEFENNLHGDSKDDKNVNEVEDDDDNRDQADTGTAMNVPKFKPGASIKLKDKIQWRDNTFTLLDQTWKHDSDLNDGIIPETPMIYFPKYLTEELFYK